MAHTRSPQIIQAIKWMTRTKPTRFDDILTTLAELENRVNRADFR